MSPVDIGIWSYSLNRFITMLCTICILIMRHFFPSEEDENESLPITQTLRFRSDEEYRECCWLHERILGGLKEHLPLLVRRQPAFDVSFDFKRLHATEARRGNEIWFRELTLSAKPRDNESQVWINCKVQCSPIGTQHVSLLGGKSKFAELA